MSGHFGEALKQHYLEHIRQVKTTGGTSFQARYLSYAYHGRFEGLTASEIDQVARAQGVSPLPRIYVEVLQTMGRSAGGIFVGCDVSFDQLLILKAALLEMMRQNRTAGIEVPTLPAHAIVFFAIQGTDFFFFEASPSTDDPAVYYYQDGATQYRRVASSLSSWFWEQAFDPTKDTDSFADN